MLHPSHWKDGELAEDRQHERMKERMPENVDGSRLLAFGKWTMAEP